MCLFLSFFLSQENPRGLNAVAPATPTPEALQAVCQRTCTEALQQLALYAPGAAAMRRDAGVVEALQAVAARGMSKEAQDLAATALLALSDRQPPPAGGSGEGAGVDGDGPRRQGHVMLSYSWEHQTITKRINESLLQRGYLTWFDLTNMKGTTLKKQTVSSRWTMRLVCHDVLLCSSVISSALLLLLLLSASAFSTVRSANAMQCNVDIQAARWMQ